MANEFASFVTPEEEKTLQPKPPNEFGDFVQNPEDDMSFYEQYGRDPRKWTIEAVKNAPESAMNLLVNIGSMIARPKETIRGVADLAQATGNKIGRNVAELVHGEEMEVMPERSEVAADVVGGDIADRYGGVENILRTAVEDPVGMGFDVGGIGGTVVRPLRSVEPMTAVSRQVDKLATKGAETAYADAMQIPRSMDATRRQELIDVGMDTDISASRKGLDNLGDAQKNIETYMNDIIDNMGAADRFDVSEINKHLEDLMRGYEGKAGGAEKIAEVRRQQGKLQDEFIYRDKNGYPVLDPQGRTILRTDISARELQDFKTDIYPRVYKRERDISDATRREGAQTKTMKQQARASKDMLNRAYPELIDPNIKWGKYAELKPMVERSMERFQELDSGLIPYISKSVRNPSWRSKMAISVRKMADGDFKFGERELGSRDLRIALVLAGRNQEALEEGTERRVPQIEIRNGVTQ